MGFHEPHQHAHKLAGVKAALASPNTPTHLKPHLAARLETNMAKNKMCPTCGKPMNGASDMDGDEPTPAPMMKRDEMPGKKKMPKMKAKKVGKPSAFFGEA